MIDTNNDSLYETILEIRNSEFPNVPEDLLLQILDLESEILDERKTATSDLQKILSNYFGR